MRFDPKIISNDDRKRGDIWLWSGRNPIALAIRAVTRSRWSHCGWWLDKSTVLESDIWGVRKRDAGVYLSGARDDRLVTVRLGAPEDDLEAALRVAVALEGSPYDLRLILSLLVAFALRKRHGGEQREWDGAYVCSELVAEPLFKTCSYRFVPDSIDIDATTPEDIWRAAKNSTLEVDNGPGE